MTFRAALLLVGLVNCGAQCPGVMRSAAFDGGSATIFVAAVNETLVPMGGFDWPSYTSPAITKVGSFEFRFGDASSFGRFHCDAVPWAVLESGQPTSIASMSCRVAFALADDAGAYGPDTSADVTDGTLTSASTIDKDGNGSLTIAIDVPSTVTSFGRVELGGLSGVVTFDSASCGSGCESHNGFW